MNATGIVDQSARIQQSLSELTFRAHQIGEQIQVFKKNNTKQILGLSRELDRSRRQPRKFVPLYNRAKFLQWNEKILSQLNGNLLRLFLQMRIYEEKLQAYVSTIHELNAEMIHD
ncbi:MAG: hypothetical protein O7C59_11275 [Rickettsia endosymbiont of Ixodes persulcatus]|nr:hypothetical protein [Rickettsia endosymbiont of Ixodes persulcatus]